MSNIWIERYVQEVGEHLPTRSRADIQAEIRSLIEDTLEGRAQAVGQPPDEEMTKAVLKEFGAPEKIAASYLPPRYLIGPRLYPIFTLVLKIVLAVMGAMALFRFGVAFSQSDLSLAAFWPAFWEALGVFYTSSLAALGNIVLVFAILERVMRQKQEQPEAWDPNSLKAIPEPERAHPAERIAEIIGALALIILFNFYPQVIGIYSFSNGQWTHTPLLSEAFFRYLPWLNLVWLLSLVLQIILLRQRNWNPATRWFSVAVDTLTIGVFWAMVVGPSVVDLSPAALQQMLGAASLEDIPQLSRLAEQGLRLLFVLIIVLEAVDVVKTLYGLLWKKPVAIQF